MLAGEKERDRAMYESWTTSEGGCSARTRWVTRHEEVSSKFGTSRQNIFTLGKWLRSCYSSQHVCTGFCVPLKHVNILFMFCQFRAAASKQTAKVADTIGTGIEGDPLQPFSLQAWLRCPRFITLTAKADQCHG